HAPSDRRGRSCTASATAVRSTTCTTSTKIAGYRPWCTGREIGDRSSEHLESAEVRCDNRVLARADAERRPSPWAPSTRTQRPAPRNRPSLSEGRPEGHNSREPSRREAGDRTGCERRA